MADETPEVTHALVRLMKGEIDVRSLPNEELYALARGLLPDRPRSLLHQALSTLNDRGETFSQIGTHLGVHAATAARWAKPPTEDRRRRRDAESAGQTQ